MTAPRAPDEFELYDLAVVVERIEGHCTCDMRVGDRVDIRGGKLAAFKLGRTYRIPKRSLELLLWATRTRPDLTLRDYSSEQIAEFIRADQLDPETQKVADRFVKATERKGGKRSAPLADVTPSP